MKKSGTKTLIFALTLILTLTFTSQIFTVNANGVKIDDALHPGNLPTLQDSAPENLANGVNTYIYALIGALALVAGGLTVFFIFDAGFNFLSSMGSDDKINKAKKELTWAILGFLLMIVSYQLVKLLIWLAYTPDK